MNIISQNTTGTLMVMKLKTYINNKLYTCIKSKTVLNINKELFINHHKFK